MIDFEIKTRKKLGQNFLVDKNIADKIINSADLKRDENVIEIGPGLGMLTERILKKVDHLTVIEIDNRIVDILNEKFVNKINENRLKIIHADALKVDWLQFEDPFVVISNLPYQISTPILFLLQDLGARIDRMVLMLQQEVGDRIVSSPGSKVYGTLSVLFQKDFLINRLFKVSPTVFKPEPEVMSGVLNFVRRIEPVVKLRDKDFFKKVVKASFGTRRKTLRNCLKQNKFIKSPEDVQLLEKSTDIDLNRRGETLTLQEFAKLSEFLFNNN